MATSPPSSMKNLIVPILGAVSIVSTGAVAWLLATPPSVDPRTVKLESELQEAKQTIARLKSELARKPAALSIGSSVTDGASSEPAASVAAPKPGANGVVPSGNLREMLTNPDMRKMLSEQQAAQIEVGFGQLFEELRLTPEERTNLKELLTSRQNIITDLSLQLMDPNLTPEKRKELMDEAKHQQSVYAASIREFLNSPEDWNKFVQWEDTMPERTYFNTMGRGLFNASSEPLSTPQEQQLLQLMAEVRKSPTAAAPLNEMAGGDPSKITPEMIQQQIVQVESNNRIIREKAEAFMSPTQLTTLDNFLAQMKAMAQNSIRTSEMILRGASQ